MPVIFILDENPPGDLRQIINYGSVSRPKEIRKDQYEFTDYDDLPKITVESNTRRHYPKYLRKE